ncbi:HutD/Ves family protein [Consotaella salsifontis]|uniref:HutD protein n=1 Tax=Consotaella salsifontis TaxID=1365950 RepID=A0A1T4SNJ3_9HYPH|nr:HutD family protein [Consotaella salsifontis]SKA29789.1 hypothetical protein SAMN05428963_11267 [Consotaella salsifontis]
MTILASARYRRMPWKNGGGETAEIAVFPPNAGLEEFGWRISMAHVATDGLFSAFPGIDRTLTVIEGDGIVLDFEGKVTTARLTAADAPFAFAGDVAAECRLLAGPITDLNVMTRRAAFQHHVRRLRLDGAQALEKGETTIVFALTPLAVRSDAEAETLAPRDALILDGDVILEPVAASGEALLIEIDTV